MPKTKRCEYWDCGWCYHIDTKTGKCPGFDRCKLIENVRGAWREDIAMEMRNNIMIEVDAFPADWDMLAEYFTNE